MYYFTFGFPVDPLVYIIMAVNNFKVLINLKRFIESISNLTQIVSLRLFIILNERRCGSDVYNFL